MTSSTEGTKKGRVGAYECWLAGAMKWEVRVAGQVLALASNMNECFRKAESMHKASKAAA